MFRQPITLYKAIWFLPCPCNIFSIYIAIDNRDVIGFIPVEQKSGKKAVINNYYVAAVDEKRKEILSLLLSSVVQK